MTQTSRPTESDYHRWKFQREAVHFNGGRDWFGYGHRCIDQPRLLVVDKYFRADQCTKRSFTVDGRLQVGTLREALDALAIPPALSIEEASLLATVPDDWFRPEQRAPLLILSYMGLVEWSRDAEKRVICRRTEAGRDLVAGDRRDG
jgi:hypothetical protein